MVTEQVVARGIRDDRVLRAMERIPRHLFLPEDVRGLAYEDRPVEIGLGQTISQPYMVAYMTATLKLRVDDRVLEVGTGSGYQTAVLCEVGAEVYTVERIPELAGRAQQTLAELGYRNVHFRIGDGTEGCPDEAPFDSILVTAGAPTAPVVLISELTEGGRMLVPIGDEERQELVLFIREHGRVTRTSLCSVAFVKLFGKEGWTT